MNTPFIDFKATEISLEKQNEYFVEPKYINRLISPNAALIYGERGSGKTTILKHLEKIFNCSDEFEYIGIYYRFETAHAKALNNPEMAIDKNILAFSQAISAIIVKLLCEVLVEIKRKRNIVYEREQVICRKVSLGIELGTEKDASTFEELGDILETVRRKTLINLQNGKSKCYLDYTTLVNDFCTELRKELIFEKTCFCVLFDEFENLTYSEQRVINSFIKTSSYYLTYKVCMRPEGFLTKETVAEREQLIEGHDYETIDYVSDIVGSESDVKKHLRQICSNRLEYFYNQHNVLITEDILNVDFYLEVVKEDKLLENWERIDEYKDELKEKICSVHQFYKNNIETIDSVIDLKLILILLEKKYSIEDIIYNLCNHTEKYKNWVHNYKQNVIFQIISECEQVKKYCGFDTFIKISNSNTRRILEMLHYAFGDYSTEGKPYKKININRQTLSVNKVATASFDEITYIPQNGYKVKNLANSLGNLFAEFLQDKQAKKFEVNSFSIRTTKNLSEEKMRELKDVLRDAIVWGVLLPSKATKVKNLGDIVFDGKDYMLHPIYAPFFKISYRKRQKCELDDIELYSMLEVKPRKEIKAISKEITDLYKQEKLEFV